MQAYGKKQHDLGRHFYFARRDGPLGDKLYEYKDKPLEDVLHTARSYENHLLATNQPVENRQPLQIAAVQPPELSQHPTWQRTGFKVPFSGPKIQQR
jgi:hypothetical protein